MGEKASDQIPHNGFLTMAICRAPLNHRPKETVNLATIILACYLGEAQGLPGGTLHLVDLDEGSDLSSRPG